MNKSMKRMLCFGLIVLMLTAGIPMMFPSVSANNDPLNTHGTVHVTGDWTVTDNRPYDGGTQIQMDTGNVIVANGGTLSLDNAAIWFHSNSNGQHGIVVQSGGTFNMKNNAQLTVWTPFTFYCEFLDGSRISLKDSTINGPGGTSGPNYPTTGVFIQTKNATISGMFFQNNRMNTALIDLENDVTIKNSTLDIWSNVGLVADAPNNVTIYDSLFTTSFPFNYQEGMSIYDGTNATVEHNMFMNIDDPIYVDSNSYLWAKKNNIHNNSGTGISVQSQGTADLIDNEIDDNGVGIYMDSLSVVNMWGHNRLINNNQDGVQMGGMATLNSKGTDFRDNNINNIYDGGATINITGGLMISNTGGTSLNMMSLSSGTIEGTVFDGGANNAVQLSSVSTLTMNKCTIFAHYTFPTIVVASGSTLTMTNSTVSQAEMIIVVTQSTLLSYDNTYIDFDRLFMTYLHSSIVSERDVAKSSINGATAGQAILYSDMQFLNLNAVFTGTGPAMVGAGDHSTVEVTDSTVSMGATPFANYVATHESGVTVINTPSDPSLALTDETGRVDFGWHTQVKTVWQNNAVAPGAQVLFNNQTGHTMMTRTTDNKGYLAVDVIAQSVDVNGITEHNDYNLTATIAGMTGKLQVNVSDNMVGAKNLVIHIVDTDQPFVNISSPADKLITNAHSIDISGYVLDNGSGIAKIELKVGNGVTKEVIPGAGGYYMLEDYGLDLDGDQQIDVVVTDLAGNTATAQIGITVDWTNPVITVSQPTAYYLTNGTFLLNGTTEPKADLTIDGTDVTVANNGSFSLQMIKTDGKYNITLSAVDLAGNTFKAFKEVMVDTTAPGLTFQTVMTPTATPALTMKGTMTDAMSGPASVQVNGKNATLDKKNGTWSIDMTLAEGPNTITMVCKDVAGNSVTKTTSVDLDTVKPVLSITAPTAAQPLYTNKPTINVTGKVTELHLATLTVNGVAVTPNANGNFSSTVTLVNGTNTLTVAAKDTAGNSAQWTYTVILDQVAPKITILSPATGFLTNQATVLVTAFVDDSSANVTLMNSKMTQDQQKFSLSANLIVGENTLTISAKDLAGNVGTASVKVTYDNVATLILTKPSKTSTKTTTPSITITGTSELGSKIYVNDVIIKSNPDGTFTYKMLVKEGKTKVTVKAVDPAGNPVEKTFTATRTEAKQYEMSMLLGLGIVLMIIGLIIGVVVGRALAKPKAPKPVEEEYPEAPTKAAPKVEEKPFTPEEEPVEEPAPAEKGSLKDKQKDVEAKPTESESKPKVEPKPEPKPAPKVEPKPEPKPETKTDSSLDDLLKNLDKK